MSDTATTKKKYVYVEMILTQNNKHDVIPGLLKGIFKKDDKIFIALHGLNESTVILNTKFYGIMSIEILEEDYKNMVFLTSDIKDQTDGLKILEDSLAELLLSGIGLKEDSSIIDINLYKDVPVEYKSGKSIDATKANTSTDTFKNTSGFIGNTHAAHYQTNNNGITYTKTVVRAEPEPAILVRTETKKPDKAVLLLMEEKLDGIIAGTFIPVLPETITGEETEADLSDDVDEVYGRYYKQHGGWSGGFC